MKEGLHPEYHPVVFVDSAADFELVTRSTKTSGETRQIDGVEHYVIRVEISSASHPFFTGEQRFVDTAGRVEKFQRKYQQFYQAQDDAKQQIEKVAAKNAKKATPAPASDDAVAAAEAEPEASAAEGDVAATEAATEVDAATEDAAAPRTPLPRTPLPRTPRTPLPRTPLARTLLPRTLRLPRTARKRTTTPKPRAKERRATTTHVVGAFRPCKIRSWPGFRSSRRASTHSTTKSCARKSSRTRPGTPS